MKIFVQVILYIFLIGVIFLLITSKTEVFGIRTYVVLTGSMEPTIPAGSVIFVQRQTAYHTDEIITFKQGSVEVTHRIISIQKNRHARGYQTKGDSNQTPDTSLVYHNNISGRVTFHIPFLGTLVIFLKTFPGLLIFIVLPGILFILVELHTIKNELQKKYEN